MGLTLIYIDEFPLISLNPTKNKNLIINYKMSLLSRFPKSDSIWNYSNPRTVQRRARLLYGRKATVFRSNLKTKKYFIIDDDGKKVSIPSVGTASLIQLEELSSVI